MSITDQLDTQSHATNVVKLGMRKGTVGTTPALKLPLGVEATPPDFRHNRTELDALHKLEDHWMMQKRKMKNIWSSNRERIKVVRNGACLSNENKNCMSLATGKVGENVVAVLRDTGVRIRK